MKKLILVDPESTKVSEMLGISEDRMIELNDLIEASIKKCLFEKGYRFTNGAFDISQKRNDEQEYTFAIILFVRGVCEFENKMSGSDQMINLLRAMGK